MSRQKAKLEKSTGPFGARVRKAHVTMRCPFCGNPDSQVKDSRPNEEGSAIRRRRACLSCGQRFTTVERVQLRDLIVVKADGRRAPFEREKITRSIRIALRKRPVSESRIEQIVTGLVRQLEATGETEVPSARIGELAMDGLREVDTVGYVRFASVYRDFTEGRDFSEILTSMDSLEPDSQEKTGPRGIKKP